MKYKKNIRVIIFLLVLSASKGYAQKADLDRTWVLYNYTTLPSSPLPTDCKSYNVVANTPAVLNAYFSKESLENLVSVTGLQKTYDQADITVFIRFSDLIINASEIKERVEVQKNKEGVETGRTYYYWVQILYSYSASAKLVNNLIKKDIYEYSIQRGDDKLVYKTEEFNRREGAVTFFNNNRLELKSILINKEVNEKTEELSKSLTSIYGYKKAVGTYHMWFLGSDKHPEFKVNNNYIENIKFHLKQINADEPITPEIKDGFKLAIDYFNDLKLRFKSDDKNDKKIRYSAFYNLSTIYFFLEDWENATKEVEGLIANDYDKGDGKTLIRNVNNAKQKLEINNVQTSHFVNTRLTETP